MTNLAPPAGAPKPVPLSSDEINSSRSATNERERLKIHRILLTESLRRLRAGRTLERAHGVIHPEMTAITRDCLRLTELVFPGAKPVDDEGISAVTSEGAQMLCELVAAKGAAKVAKVANVSPSMLKALQSGNAAPSREVMVRLLVVGIPIESWGAQ